MRDSQFKSRALLMESSLDEFCRYPYDQASLNRIIKAADISKGTFYYHFKNKEALYSHLLKVGVEAKWAFIHNYTRDHEADFEVMDLFDQFLYQAKAGTVFANSNPKYHQLANMFAKEKGRDIYKQVIEDIGGESTDVLKTMIAKAYKEGQLDTAFEIAFVEQLLEQLFTHYDDFHENSENLEENLKNLESFVRFMKYGLTHR